MSSLLLLLFLLPFPLRVEEGPADVDASGTSAGWVVDDEPPVSRSMDATKPATPAGDLEGKPFGCGGDATTSSSDEVGPSSVGPERRESEESEVMDARRAAVVSVDRF